MLVVTQIYDFIGFFIVGISLSAIFDFFRAYRKIKKVSLIWVIVQDIIYFFITTFVIIIAVINILDSNLRLYIFIAMILGSMLHFSAFSAHIIKFYIFIINASKEIFLFLNLPISLFMYFAVKICIFLKKIVKKCCKKFFYVITLIKKKILKISFKITKQKRVIDYEKST